MTRQQGSPFAFTASYIICAWFGGTTCKIKYTTQNVKFLGIYQCFYCCFIFCVFYCKFALLFKCRFINFYMTEMSQWIFSLKIIHNKLISVLYRLWWVSVHTHTHSHRNLTDTKNETCRAIIWLNSTNFTSYKITQVWKKEKNVWKFHSFFPASYIFVPDVLKYLFLINLCCFLILEFNYFCREREGVKSFDP